MGTIEDKLDGIGTIKDIVMRYEAINRYLIDVRELRKNKEYTSYIEHRISNSLSIISIGLEIYKENGNLEAMDEKLKTLERYVSILENYPEAKRKEMEENNEGNGYYKEIGIYGSSYKNIRKFIDKFTKEKGIDNKDLDEMYKRIFQRFKPKAPEIKEIDYYDIPEYIRHHRPFRMKFIIDTEDTNQENIIRLVGIAELINKYITGINVDFRKTDKKYVSIIKYSPRHPFSDKIYEINVKTLKGNI